MDYSTAWPAIGNKMGLNVNIVALVPGPRPCPDSDGDEPYAAHCSGIETVKHGHQNGDVIAGAGKRRCGVGKRHAGGAVAQVDKAEHGA